TRFDCDWSSDVCSSDLADQRLGRGRKDAADEHRRAAGAEEQRRQRIEGHGKGPLAVGLLPAKYQNGASRQEKEEPKDRGGASHRSEERRVGKECRERC